MVCYVEEKWAESRLVSIMIDVCKKKILGGGMSKGEEGKWEVGRGRRKEGKGEGNFDV